MSNQSLPRLKELLITDPEIKTFFKNYSNINETDLISKALAIHDRASLVHKYRCIESFRFLVPRIKYNPFYTTILEKSKDRTFLDIGCGLGQDLRKLSLDGVPQQNLFGLDIEREFINLGYELFNDQHTNKIHFFTGNIFDKEFFESLKHRMTFNIIYTNAVLHLLNKSAITTLLCTIYSLLSEHGVFFGQTTGLQNPQEILDRTGPGGLRFLHSKDSLEEALLTIGFTKVKIIVKEQNTLLEKRVESGSGSSSGKGPWPRVMLNFYCEK